MNERVGGKLARPNAVLFYYRDVSERIMTNTVLLPALDAVW